jgi:NAD(P)-dependent dehydrogenase (short-subunit alcohol dehydrogenase family)
MRMNAIAPGPIPTQDTFPRLLPRPELERAAKERIPLGRFWTPEEFANLAAFLISDSSEFINGEVVTLDGGEWLQVAGEFTTIGRMLTDDKWQNMRPAKPSAK